MVHRRMRLEASRGYTLSGLLHRKMLHDRRPILTTVADKWAARAYIETQLGPGYLPVVLASAESPGDIDWSGLPQEYVAKVNHGSGGVVMVSDDADPSARLPHSAAKVGWANFRVSPEHAEEAPLVGLLAQWLSLDYSWVSGHRSIQWCYADIPRRVMVEELLRDFQGRPPREYRLFVIGGRVRFLQVEMVEAGTSCTAVMAPTWERIPARFLNPPPSRAPERPAALHEMLDVAEELGRPIGDFLRVDVYDLGSRLVVGELTNYPYGGRLPVRPRSHDQAWAQCWPAWERALRPGRHGKRRRTP